MGDVRVHLRGGPVSGRQVHIDADGAGRPVPRVSFPAPNPHGGSRVLATPPLLIYERVGVGPDGTWYFRYIGAEYG